MIPSHMSYSPATLLAPSPLTSDSKVAEGKAAKLRDTAKDLEATFLSLLLKEMRQALEPEGLFPGDTSDVQGGLFDLFMSKHLADSGGVGVAAALVRQMTPVEGVAKQIAFPDGNGSLDSTVRPVVSLPPL